MNKSKDASWFHKLSIWIRGNIFIPDPRVFWVKPSVHYLSAYLKKHPVELIVSTGPPHSMHLIAKHLRQKLSIAWLADFRDPWTQIFYFETLHLNRLSRFIHSKLEKSVLRQADVVVTVSRSCKDDLESICGRKVEVITNGFEPFENRNLIKPNKERIVLLYAGVLTQDRNPELLWNALKEYVVENPDIQQRLEIRFIGNVDPYVVQSARSMNAFKVNHLLPMSHEELQNHLWEADALMLIGVPGNKGVVTGKFFEYLFLKKPILSVSPPDSDLVEMLIQTQTGYNADFIDQVGLRNAVDQIFDTLIHKNFKPNEPVISSYSRRNLTHQMAEFMNTAVEQFKSKGPHQ
ncbi:MAG: glycosyltransferase [Saprospiraceae bacterium]|nr:glycosyltransferase [Saprospiraceae bacterium]